MTRAIAAILSLSLFSLPLFGQIETILKGEESSRIELFNLSEFDSTRHSRIYRIWLSNFQIIELIESIEGKSSGCLVSYLTKLHQKKAKVKYVFEKLVIPDKQAEYLLTYLEKENYVSLLDSKKLEGYPNITDGMSYVFESIFEGGHNKPMYISPMSDYYPKTKCPDMDNVRNILTELSRLINMDFHIDNLKNNVGPGRYNYGMVIMEIK